MKRGKCKVNIGFLLKTVRVKRKNKNSIKWQERRKKEYYKRTLIPIKGDNYHA